MRREFIPWLVAFCLLASTAFLVVEYSRKSMLINILEKKDQLLSEGYAEAVMKMLQDNRENTMQIAREQGKLEGIVTAVENLDPDKNAHSAIWHQGYYHGLAQGAEEKKAAYEDGYRKGQQEKSTTVAAK